jgi:rare lipoprotein A (peptidoglycan hydrolase)
MRGFLAVSGVLFPLLLQGCSGLLGRNQPPPPLPVPPEPLGQEELAKPEGKKVEQIGKASWYGPYHDGKETANGEIFDPDKFTAASPTLPLGSTAVVTNLETGKSVKVKINDRGPYVKGRKIDLSQAAAKKIGLTKKGVAKVKIVSLAPRKAKKKLARKQRKRPPTQVAKETSPAVAPATPPQNSAQEGTDSAW